MLGALRWLFLAVLCLPAELRLPGTNLPVETFRLENGLTVVVQRDPGVPVVAGDIVYGVGSLDEKPGRSGFAHLFEHLMAQGTKSLKPREITELISSLGGERNASTSRSFTAYRTVIPSGGVEPWLWAEAERMHLLNVDERALTLEQRVVLQERFLRYLNVPYARASDEGLAEALFSRWENRHPTIGDRRDIESASLEDVRAFYRDHYAPSKAVLALSGDITAERARELVGRYFGAIPPAPETPRPDLSEAPLPGERWLKRNDPLAPRARLFAGWLAPPRGSRDYWALRVASALLSQSAAWSPLRRTLIERGAALAAEVEMPHWSEPHAQRGPDAFTASLVPASGRSARSVVSAFEGLLARLARRGPPRAALAAAKALAERAWLEPFDSLLGRAQFLGRYAALIGDPELLEEDRRSLLAVTGKDVQRALRRWVVGQGKGVVEVVPGPAPEEPKPNLREVPPAGPRAPGDAPPAAAPIPPARLPELFAFSLSNGLKVIAVRDDALPVARLRLSLEAGPAAELPGEAGLAAPAAALLFKGGPRRSAAAISAAVAQAGFGVKLDAKGRHLSIEADGLSRGLSRFLRELGKTLGGAAFPDKEVALWKGKAAANLELERAKASFQSREALKKALLPGHPLGRPEPDEAAIEAVTSARLQAFRRGHMAPHGATLVVVGPFEPAALKRKLEGAFKGWTGASARQKVPPAPEGAAGLVRVPRAGSTQVDLTLAIAVPVSRRHPDFLALSVANEILGGGASGRLFLNLRVDKGYTYGAYSRLETHPRFSVWRAEAQVDVKAGQASLDEMRKEIRLLREQPVTPETLEKFKQLSRGQRLRRLASKSGLAERLDGLASWGEDAQKAETEWLAKLEALTPADVQSAARRYLDLERMVVIAVGEPAAIDGLR